MRHDRVARVTLRGWADARASEICCVQCLNAVWIEISRSFSNRGDFIRETRIDELEGSGTHWDQGW